MNVTLLTGSPQITQDSSILDRLALGGSTTLLGMAIVSSVLCIIFIALQIMRAVFTKNASQTKKARKAEKAVQTTAPKPEVAPAAEPVAPAAEPAVDDGAIVAAIIVAISAHTGKAPEGFRVVSFKKRK